MRGVMRSLVALTLSVLALGSAHAQQPSDPPPPPQDVVLGSAEARLEIIEYGSYACPPCGHFHENNWHMINSEFVETGQVRFIFRPIVTPPEQMAAAGAFLSYCVGDERYYDAVDLLFMEQTNIIEGMRNREDVLGIYARIAGALGRTQDEMLACFNDEANNTRLMSNLYQASLDGVRGTPSFMFNGVLLSSQQVDGEYIFIYGEEPLIINGDRVPAEFTEDSFRRIILHFLTESDSD